MGARKITSILLSLIAISTSGCAPEVVEREYKPIVDSFGPRQEDPDLGLENIRERAVVDASSLTWKGQVASASLFRAAADMIELGRQPGREEIATAALRLGDSFYKGEATASKIPFAESPYVSAAIGETKQTSLKLIQDGDEFLSQQSKLIESLVKADVKEGRGPRVSSSRVQVRDLFEAVQRYIEEFIQLGESRGIDSRIMSAFRATFERDVKAELARALNEVTAILNEKRPLKITSGIRSFARANQFPLSPSAEQRIADAELIMRKVEAVPNDDIHQALVLLVDLWEMVPQADREATFKTVSPDLYKLLNRPSEELECLKATFCPNPVAVIMKTTMVYPALRKHGVPQIKADVNSAIRVKLIAEFMSEAVKILPNVPGVMNARIQIEIEKARVPVRAASADYSGFVRKMARKFSSTHLPGGDLEGLEVSRVEVDISPGRTLVRAASATPVPMAGSVPAQSSNEIETGAEVLGASLSFASARWILRESQGQSVTEGSFTREALSQVNKLLAMGGFKTETNTLFPSFSVAVNPAALLPHMNIRTIASATNAYAVPDRMIVAPDFSVKNPSERRASVSAQAELLKGLSSMIRHFRDWEVGTFDRRLGQIDIKDLIEDLPADGIEQKFFPKDLFFALGVGNAAAILQNMLKPLTTVFLLNPERRSIWANEFDFSEGNAATMAGIVDIINGRRVDSVSSGDVSRFLLAVVDFLESVEGIEQTRAGPLLEPDASGKRPVDILIESKPQLRLLVVGLANFISHQMQDDDGGVRALFTRTKSETQRGGPRRLIDQVLAIQALTRAGNLLDMNIYRWAALDALVFMNRSMWNASVGFYSSVELGISGEGTPSGAHGFVAASLEEITATLVAGERLRDQMPLRTRTQWDLIAKPWLAGLKDL